VNEPGNIQLYHLGNNALHRHIYWRALAEPGIAVIHDAVLQHFFLGMLEEASYVEEFVYNYGEWTRSLATELWRERARSGADARYFAYPMLRRVIEQSLAVIVHNPAAGAIVREHGAQNVFEIPHLFDSPQMPAAADFLRLRNDLGVPLNQLLVGTFGHQRETKRLGVLARAFRSACDQGANARLLVTGEFVSKPYADAIEPLLVQSRAIRAGHLSDGEFWNHLAATDVCVNLRYPTAAETSGVAIRMMGMGKAVIFTRDAATDRYPEGACLRVDPGPAEEKMLADYILMLAYSRDVVSTMGRNAAEHVAREHAPQLVATQYWNAIRSQ
jgi:glycosyltransferase involved in cell wall biosynthesis